MTDLELLWGVNRATGKKVPLRRWSLDGTPEKAVRYIVIDPKDNAIERNDEGDWYSHFADCPGAKQFSGRNK